MSTFKKKKKIRPFNQNKANAKATSPKEKNLEFKVNFPDPIEETKKGWGGSWLVNTGSSLFLEFEEGAPKGFPVEGHPLRSGETEVQLLSHAF